METLKRVFSFYINSSIHVAIAIVALIKITFLKFEIAEAESYIYFSFFASIVAYNFVKYVNVANLYHKRLTKSMKWIQGFTVISGLFAVYFGYTLPMYMLWYLLPFLLLTVLYAVPIFPKKKNLRSVAGIKIFIIAMVWTGITVLVPIMYMDTVMSFDVMIEILQRFLLVIILMLPFEIRDLQYDAGKLETIPQKIGVAKTKVFGSILLVVFLVVTIFKAGLFSIEILSTVVIAIVCLLFLWNTEKKQSEYFCSFWVESIPIFWLLIIILLQQLFG